MISLQSICLGLAQVFLTLPSPVLASLSLGWLDSLGWLGWLGCQQDNVDWLGGLGGLGSVWLEMSLLSLMDQLLEEQQEDGQAKFSFTFISGTTNM